MNKSNSQIDALIRADHYCDFMTAEVKRGNEGLAIIKTILGLVLNRTFQSQSYSPTSVKLYNSHVLKISAIEQKSICTLILQGFWKSKTVTKRKIYSRSRIQRVKK